MAKVEDIDPQELLNYFKQQYSTNPSFKSEFVDKSSNSVNHESNNPTNDLVNALNQLNLGNSFTSTAPQYNKGDSFITHCKRYSEFVDVVNLGT